MEDLPWVIYHFKLMNSKNTVKVYICYLYKTLYLDKIPLGHVLFSQNLYIYVEILLYIYALLPKSYINTVYWLLYTYNCI